MTDEEIESELVRLEKATYPHTCKRMFSNGLCVLCEDKAKICRVMTNHRDCRNEEIPEWLRDALGCDTPACPHKRRG